MHPPIALHPTMADWLAELHGPDALSEARRFLDVVRRGGADSPAAYARHQDWMKRPGFEAVYARACALVGAA